MEYKTISEKSLERFDEECKKLDAQGYHPLFGLCVTTIPNYNYGQTDIAKMTTLYTQQWQRIKPRTS